ncbi:MAG: class A beta-lactamase-related serine hydrolase [Flavobacteriaceae bacterium]|nr:beta-lactamase family protein [Flavobacteriaceae bacterium]RZW56675.1 MAG: class A beta-lactamase-related serine hydrolase [Flavobacteriaceae bacterium]
MYHNSANRILIFCVFFFIVNSSFAQETDVSDLDLTTIEIKADSIMKAGIKQKAFPGAQLMVIKKGVTVFHKTYGFHTYDSLVKVKKDDIYDMASVTKVAGPLLAIMKLYDDGEIDLDRPFSNYWKPWKRQKDKKDLTLRELLAHQAGMEPYIVFLSEVQNKNRFKRRFIRNKKSKRFSRKVYDSLYVKNGFERKIFRIISRSKVQNEKTYLYSGLASLIYPKLIEDLTGQTYETYMQNTFYKPLGCLTFGYNPLEKGLTQIVPTEVDTLFRKTLVKGYVHDENAALFGGVSGNAGLFGTASDLSHILQMLLQKGTYNGRTYFSEATVNEFIKVQYPENGNRRALGFDKPLIGNDTLDLKDAYPAPEVSRSSFGHSGFTGTFAWADPEEDLVFIFLSNRVYPNRSHRNIYNLNIRPSLQRLFYVYKNSKNN